jgi:diadenosine tetraphosphate (Ap4A) HIT family hydrolase
MRPDPACRLPPQSPFYPLDPAGILMADSHCVAFLDRYPVSAGHALVIPWSPSPSLYDLDPALQAAVWNMVRQVRELLRVRFHPDGFNVGLNDGLAAGQTVPHTHVHIIPRYTGDSPDSRGGIRRIFPERALYGSLRAEPIRPEGPGNATQGSGRSARTQAS